VTRSKTFLRKPLAQFLRCFGVFFSQAWTFVVHPSVQGFTSLGHETTI